MPGDLLPAGQATADAAVRGLLGRVTRLGGTCTSGPESHNACQPVRELVHGGLEVGMLSARLAGCSGPGAWISPGLAAARFLYLLTGRRDLRLIAPFSSGARKFSADGVSLGGSAYGARLLGTAPGDDQLARCVEVITSRPNTKRAIALLSDPLAGNGDSIDVACCLAIIFLPREGTLDASVIMRANDALRLLPYNVFEFSMLLELTARLTGLRAGTYRHMAVSMHLRGDHDIREAAALAGAPPCPVPVDMGTMPDATWDTVVTLAGHATRLSEATASLLAGLAAVTQVITDAAPLGPYWQDVIAAAAARGLARNGGLPAARALLKASGTGPLLAAELACQQQAATAPGPVR